MQQTCNSAAATSKKSEQERQKRRKREEEVRGHERRPLIVVMLFRASPLGDRVRLALPELNEPDATRCRITRHVVGHVRGLEMDSRAEELMKPGDTDIVTLAKGHSGCHDRAMLVGFRKPIDDLRKTSLVRKEHRSDPFGVFGILSLITCDALGLGSAAVRSDRDRTRIVRRPETFGNAPSNDLSCASGLFSADEHARAKALEGPTDRICEVAYVHDHRNSGVEILNRKPAPHEHLKARAVVRDEHDMFALIGSRQITVYAEPHEHDAPKEKHDDRGPDARNPLEGAPLRREAKKNQQPPENRVHDKTHDAHHNRQRARDYVGQNGSYQT